MRFGYDDEDALALVADRLGGLIRLVQQGEAEAPAAEAAPATRRAGGRSWCATTRPTTASSSTTTT